MWKFERYSGQNKRKSLFWTTPLSFEAPSQAKTCEYPYKSYLARNCGPWARFLPLIVWAYLAPLRRYGGLLVEKSQKSPVRTHPSLRNRPRSGWPLSNLVMSQTFPETRMIRLSDGEEIMTLAIFILIQYRSVTDGQTDRRTDIPPLAIPAVCIARYANALVKT